ncbi:MAG: outer membrane protein assembly factor BamA, partial [Chlamydiae bacterium]|nr:outer membrane protein assembly factor BamA [Chlamydiota bacterium]
FIDVQEGRSGKIADIMFEGFSKAEQSTLLDMIYTKKYNLFLSWLTGSGIYQEEALEQDQLTIGNYLQNQGYADAKVKISIEEAPQEGKIIIKIQANRGELYHFGKIAFQGNHIFSDQEIEEQFVARPGSIYSPEKLRLSSQNIKDLYGRKGYIEANVQYETRQVPGQLLYAVEFLISEGEQYKIGLIHVTGNTQTKTSVILRESLLVPGEIFDSAKLKATQQRLESIGYFKNVNVYAVRTQDDVLLGDNYRDVYIEVEETTTGNISLFFGFSSADSIFGGLDFAETNFNYQGIPRIFTEGLSALRGGGEFLRARASFGTKQNSYTLSWMTPYFRDTLWRVGLDSSYASSELQAKDYYTNTISGSAFASYPLNSLWTFGSKYRIKQTLTHVKSDAPSQEKQQAGHDGLLSAVSSSITFDSTDSALKPRKGFRSFIEGEFAGVGGDTAFLRLRYINSYYTPLWRRGTMKYRFDLQFLEPVLKTHSPNDVFVSERFFLGGENSVRGYKAFHLGPIFKDSHGKASVDPKGGISSTLLSMEYLQEVMKMLDLFAFIDAGALSMHRFTIPQLRFTYGVGARIDLLNRIPLVLGVGFPVNPLHKKQVENFFFSMGGQF